MLRALLVSIFIFCAGRSEIVDRIAVSVGDRVITTDQIHDEIAVTAFLNGAEPVFGPAEKTQAAERLIEQALIRREMDFTHYPLPPLSEADGMVKNTETRYPDHAVFLKALAKYDITEQDLRQHLWWQFTLLKFIDERFRPAVQVGNAEIRQYYREQAAKWEREGVKPIPSFQESRAAMEKALTEERVDKAVDRWLGDARRQVDIQFRKGVLQ